MIAPLNPLSLPNYPALTPDVIASGLDEALSTLKTTIESVVSDGSLDFEESWTPIERANVARAGMLSRMTATVPGSELFFAMP